jgi:hypothetical protein
MASNLPSKFGGQFFFIGAVGGGVQLGPLGTAATNRPIVSAPGGYDGGEIGGMIGKGNRSTRRKPVPVPLCPPQIPHTARTQTRAATVGSLSYGTALVAYLLSWSRYFLCLWNPKKHYLTQKIPPSNYSRISHKAYCLQT